MKTFLPKVKHNFRSLKVSELGPAVFSYDLPSAISPSAKYIFFLHGKIVEKHGPNGIHSCFGIYDYHGIVKSFAKVGFTVISEIRPEGTKLDKYAKKIVRQIETLLTNNMSFLQSQEFRKERNLELKVSVFEWLKTTWNRIVDWKVWGHLTSLIIAGIFFGLRIFMFIIEKIAILSHRIIERFRKYRSK